MNAFFQLSRPYLILFNLAGGLVALVFGLALTAHLWPRVDENSFYAVVAFDALGSCLALAGICLLFRQRWAWYASFLSESVAVFSLVLLAGFFVLASEEPAKVILDVTAMSVIPVVIILWMLSQMSKPHIKDIYGFSSGQIDHPSDIRGD